MTTRAATPALHLLNPFVGVWNTEGEMRGDPSQQAEVARSDVRGTRDPRVSLGLRREVPGSGRESASGARGSRGISALRILPSHVDHRTRFSTTMRQRQSRKHARGGDHDAFDDNRRLPGNGAVHWSAGRPDTLCRGRRRRHKRNAPQCLRRFRRQNDRQRRRQRDESGWGADAAGGRAGDGRCGAGIGVDDGASGSRQPAHRRGHRRRGGVRDGRSVRRTDPGNGRDTRRIRSREDGAAARHGRHEERVHHLARTSERV